MTEICCFWPWCEKCTALSLSHIVYNHIYIYTYIYIVTCLACKIFNFSIRLFRIWKMFCPIYSFTCPWPFDNGLCEALATLKEFQKLKNYFILSHINPILASQWPRNGRKLQRLVISNHSFCLWHNPWNWAQTAQICVIRKCTLFFSEPEEHTESLYYIPKWNWYLIYFSWIVLIQEMST